jgi:hypothetical protein
MSSAQYEAFTLILDPCSLVAELVEATEVVILNTFSTHKNPLKRGP